MPSHAPILPVGGVCFLNANIKCRILPDACDGDSAAGRDSGRSTLVPDSLLQRMGTGSDLSEFPAATALI